MPFYDFKCECCEKIFEVRLPISQCAERQDCPECAVGETAKKGTAVRVYTSAPAGWIFKNLPKGHNLSATQRRELWNSNDPNDFKKLM